MEFVSAEERRIEQFPVGMRVLAVDENPICLRKLEYLLLLCKCHVTKTTESKKALEMLREKCNMFDLVITDAEMPDSDGFKLLEIGVEMGLPVIMISTHSDDDNVVKATTHGACDYLVKPVGLKELQNIWKHVAMKNINRYAKAMGPSSPSETRLLPSVSNKQKEKFNDSDRENKDDGGGEHNGQKPRTLRYHRFVWTQEVHHKFLSAIEQLGVYEAVPNKIHGLMNLPGLTRGVVANHLESYRRHLKRDYASGTYHLQTLLPRVKKVKIMFDQLHIH